MVDVMELVCHSAGGDGSGGKGWRDFFRDAMNARGDNASDDSSALSVPVSSPVIRAPHVPMADGDTYSDVFSIGMPPVVVQQSNVALSALGTHDTANVMGRNSDFVFKITDPAGNVHRVKSSVHSYAVFKTTVASHLALSVDGLVLKYTDDDNDEVVVSTDASLHAAVDYAKSAALTALKLNAYQAEATGPSVAPHVVETNALRLAPPTPAKSVSRTTEPKTTPKEGMGTEMKLAAVGAIVAVLAVVGFVVTRPKQR